MYLTIISKNELNDIKAESDFLILFLSFSNVLTMTLLTLSVFNAWEMETVIIQELKHIEYSILNNFIFLIVAFF